MHQETMTQCTLKHQDGRIDTRWIETRLAKVGQPVIIKATGEPWVVTAVGATWPEKRVLDYERDYVAMPTVTDSFRHPDGGRTMPVKPKG